MSRKKAQKCTVAVREVRNRLILRWSFAGDRYEMAIGLPATTPNRLAAERKARQIELDIAAGHFDDTLTKYKPAYKTRNLIKVGDLFEEFIEYKSNYVYKQTLNKYKALLGYIQQFFKEKPAKNITEAEALQFRDWLNKSLAPVTVSERLTLLSACWEWGAEKKALEENPWKIVLKGFKVPPKQKPKPFSKTEMRLILQGFRTDPEYAYYGDFVEFLLGTGCRTGEVIALCWKHLNEDSSVLWIGETITVDGERKPTKTNEARFVRLNERLQKLLLSRKPAQAQPDSPVFPARRGGSTMNTRNFARRAWQSVLGKLELDYRRPYNSRHTLVSHAIASGMHPTVVAEMAGHNPKTLFKHYLGSVQGVPQLPELLDD